MSAPLIISVSGLRGEVGKTLTPEVAVRYAIAFSLSIPDGAPFVITWDGRNSGSLFADAISAALNAVGRPTLVGGVAATPTCGVLIRSLGAAGGIQISASHNPIEFNGLKLFSGEGRVIPKREGEKVLETYRALERGELTPPWRTPERLGRRGEIADTISAHIGAVLETVDAELIAAKRFRVLLDSNHGAGAVLGKPLLERLGWFHIAAHFRIKFMAEQTCNTAHPRVTRHADHQIVLTAVREEERLRIVNKNVNARVVVTAGIPRIKSACEVHHLFFNFHAIKISQQWVCKQVMRSHATAKADHCGIVRLVQVSFFFIREKKIKHV